MDKFKRLLRWPLAADDTHVYGGIVLVSAGVAFKWGWQAGLIVLGMSLLMLPIALPLLGRKVNNNVTR